jgi:hypothetical protein
MARFTVEDLIDRGPDFVRDFVRQPHGTDEFAPEFSWLLLADVVGFEAGVARDADPVAAAKWAGIAALLYEGLACGCRPQDELARDIWTRRAASYRAWPNSPPVPKPSPLPAPSGASEPTPR